MALLNITLNDEGTLETTYNHIPARLEHYHYDVFDMVNTLLEARLKTVFHTNAKGQISSLEVPLEPSSPNPIVFTRKGES